VLANRSLGISGATCLSLILVVLSGSLALAQTKPIVAVFDLETGNLKLSGQVVGALADFMSAELASSGVYSVVPRDQVKQRMLQQKKKSYRKCFDENCQIEIGRELAAQKSLSSKVIRLGKKCVVTLTLFDLRKSTTERAVTSKGACSEEALLQTLEKAVADLTAPIRGAPEPPKPVAAKKPTPLPKLSGTVLGVGMDFNIYRKPVGKSWERPLKNSCCVSAIEFGPDGHLYGIGLQRNVWRKETKDLESKWVQIANSCCVKDIVFDSQGVMLGTGLGNNVWRKESPKIDSKWTGPIANSCCVYAIGLDRRVLLGIGVQNQLWRKENTKFDSKWTGPIANSCCIKSIAYDTDGQMLGIGSQNQIWKKETVDQKSSWRGPLPGSCCVMDLIPAP